MITAGSRIRQMGWFAVLAACVALFAVLSFNVHAVKSEVLLAERSIIALERETLVLETEFQSRASQRQLAEWNSVELGYEAPRADQYLESERQLAALGTPRGVDAPSPVRVALNRPARESEGLFAEWIEGEADNATPVDGRDVVTASGLAERLASPAVGMAGVAEVSQ